MSYVVKNNMSIVADAGFELPDGTDLGNNFEGPYSACSVGKFIAQFALDNNLDDYSITKMLLLAYIAHGWLLGLTEGDSPLIDEQAEVWKVCPVYATLYDATINLCEDCDEIISPQRVLECLAEETEIDATTTEGRLIAHICNHYGDEEAASLIEITSRDGSPWEFRRSLGYSTIDDETIAQYYVAGLNYLSEVYAT